MIKQTTDYEMFKKHASNRPLDEANLIKLQRSIGLCNMLELRPILVDNQMRVIDGQHRLEAANRLSLPIFYQVNEAAEAKDMIYLNAFQKAWKAEDYLRFFAREGNQEYVKLERFLEKERISLQNAMNLMSSGFSENYRREFREGHFVFPDPIFIEETKKTIHNVKEVIDLLKAKLVGVKLYLNAGKVFSSLISFYNIKSVDHQEFLKKLQFKLDMWHPCASIEAYVEMMKQIYNWKNRDPIP